MGNSHRAYYVGLKDLDDADHSKAVELISRAFTIHAYDQSNDVYRVTTSLTQEEFLALGWPDGCTFRFTG